MTLFAVHDRLEYLRRIPDILEATLSWSGKDSLLMLNMYLKYTCNILIGLLFFRFTLKFV